MLFIELAPFARDRDDYLTDEEYRRFQSHLIDNPKAGAVMRGTGGFRKVRWAPKGRGKSGGVRIVYYFRDTKGRLYLAAIYGKSEKDNLSKAEHNALRGVVARLE